MSQAPGILVCACGSHFSPCSALLEQALELRVFLLLAELSPGTDSVRHMLVDEKDYANVGGDM